jgi:hypothetical protein
MQVQAMPLTEECLAEVGLEEGDLVEQEEDFKKISNSTSSFAFSSHVWTRD